MQVVVELVLFQPTSPVIGMQLEALAESDPGSARRVLRQMTQAPAVGGRIVLASALVANDAEVAAASTERTEPVWAGPDGTDTVVHGERRVVERIALAAVPHVAAGTLDVGVEFTALADGAWTSPFQDVDWHGTTSLDREVSVFDVGASGLLLVVSSTPLDPDGTPAHRMTPAGPARRNAQSVRARWRAIQPVLDAAYLPPAM